MLTRSPTALYEQKNKIWFKHMHCKKFIGQWKHKLKDAQLFVARQPAQSWYSLAHHDIHLPWASGQVLSYTSEHDKGRQIGKFKNDIVLLRPSIAAFASCASSKITNPNPRGRPLSLSVTTITIEDKNCRMSYTHIDYILRKGPIPPDWKVWKLHAGDFENLIVNI
jgi:hypothetical protein